MRAFRRRFRRWRHRRRTATSAMTARRSAGSWSKARRMVARVEVSPGGRDTRYIVTNLNGGRGKASISTRKSTLPAVRPGTTSRGGRPTLPRTERHARRPVPIKCASPHAAWLCLLTLVEPPRGLPKALAMVACPVRYPVAASGQAGGNHR